MKNPLVTVSIAIAVLGCGLAINAYITSANMRQNLDEERYKRIVAEEHLQATKSDMVKIRTDLAAAQKTLMSIQNLVNQGRDVTSDLKGQLEAARKERDTLKVQLEKIQTANTVPPTPALAAPAPAAGN